MADNTQLSAGTADGAIIGTDEIVGAQTVHYQEVKIVDGTKGQVTPVAVDVGAKANALRVAPANDITDGTYIGDIKFGEALPANTNTQEIVGDAAENAPVAGNPVLTGGRYDATPRTLGDGDVGAVALDADGAVQISDGGNTITVDSGAAFTVQEDGAALTALQKIDNVVAVDDTATHAAGTTEGVNIMAAATPTGATVAANDIGMVAMSTDRRLHVDAQIVGTDAALDCSGATVTVTGTVTANAGTGTQEVSLASVPSHDVTNAGTFAVQAAGDVASGSADSGNPVKIGGIFNTTPPTVTTGQRVNLQTNNRGALMVTPGPTNSNFNTNVAQMNGVATTMGNGNSGTGVQRVTIAADSTGQVKLAAGTAEIGKLAAGTAAIGSLTAGTALIGDVGISGARTSGGTTFVGSLGTSTLTQIKGTAGQLYWLHVMNLKASVLYLQIFNKASASVTLGTTTPDMVFPLPTQGDTNGAGFTLSVPNGIAFGTGISWAITTTETGATTAADNEAYLNGGYA